MACKRKNIFYFGKEKGVVFSNCNLQQKGWTDHWSMKCGCGCGEQVFVCFYCAREHARKKQFPLPVVKSKKPFRFYPCFLCDFLKCRRGSCDPQTH